VGTAAGLRVMRVGNPYILAISAAIIITQILWAGGILEDMRQTLNLFRPEEGTTFGQKYKDYLAEVIANPPLLQGIRNFFDDAGENKGVVDDLTDSQNSLNESLDTGNKNLGKLSDEAIPSAMEAEDDFQLNLEQTQIQMDTNNSVVQDYIDNLNAIPRNVTTTITQRIVREDSSSTD